MFFIALCVEKYFFNGFHVLHLLWLIWVFDMFLQIIPIKNKVALGSQKLFANRFKPIRKKINYKALKNYIKSTTASAYKVFIIWGLLITVIGVLYYFNIIQRDFFVKCFKVAHIDNTLCTAVIFGYIRFEFSN
mgnify:CR=1 FL=1